MGYGHPPDAPPNPQSPFVNPVNRQSANRPSPSTVNPSIGNPVDLQPAFCSLQPTRTRLRAYLLSSSPSFFFCSSSSNAM